MNLFVLTFVSLAGFFTEKSESFRFSEKCVPFGVSDSKRKRLEDGGKFVRATLLAEAEHDLKECQARHSKVSGCSVSDCQKLYFSLRQRIEKADEKKLREFYEAQMSSFKIPSESQKSEVPIEPKSAPADPLEKDLTDQMGKSLEPEDVKTLEKLIKSQPQ